MKNAAVGCVSLVVGMFIGALLALVATSLMNPGTTGTVEAPATDRADLSVTASSSYANTMIQTAIRQTGIAKQATVALAAPNVVRVTTPVTVPLLGQSVQVNATVALRVSVQNAKVVVKVDGVEASGINVPTELVATYMETLRTQAEDQVNRLVTRGLTGTGLRLTNIRVTADAVTVDLTGH